MDLLRYGFRFDCLSLQVGGSIIGSGMVLTQGVMIRLFNKDLRLIWVSATGTTII